MAVDPRAVSVFVVATEEAEVHGGLANGFTSGLRLCCAYCTARASITCHPVSVQGLVSVSRKPDYSPLAHQFFTLSHLACGAHGAGVATRHTSRTSSLVTALVTR